MINLKNEIVAYQKEGLSAPLARARVCQDVVLLAISKGALKGMHFVLALNLETE